jgi:hypothetical protein
VRQALAHFRTIDAAVRFYSRTEGKPSLHTLEDIRDQKIRIGPPNMEAGDVLTLDEDGRYWLSGARRE